MLNYKSVFIAILVAYIIGTMVLGVYFAMHGIELRYVSLLEVVIFFVPLLFVVGSDNSKDSGSELLAIYKPTLGGYFKLNKFPISITPFILWGLVGVMLMEMGVDVVSVRLLPDSIMEYYIQITEKYLEMQNSLSINGSGTLLEMGEIILLVALVPAVCEEFLFRGYLLRNLLVHHSVGYSVCISALIFSLIHFNPIALLPIFIIGVYLGMLYYATGSIFPSIIFHFCNNLFVIISANYEDSNSDAMLGLWLAFGIIVAGGILVYWTYSRIRKDCGVGNV
ncbi:MAG: CPBP family intramembrane metalloprotease [Ignavibacteria bacterium]|jgi:membrane protease YdiL (CAAX protease family)|nr:CPBP family intramembrane metalloprotease [Ignavibacteria bacterium]